MLNEELQQVDLLENMSLVKYFFRVDSCDAEERANCDVQDGPASWMAKIDLADIYSKLPLKYPIGICGVWADFAGRSVLSSTRATFKYIK